MKQVLVIVFAGLLAGPLEAQETVAAVVVAEAETEVAGEAGTPAGEAAPLIQPLDAAEVTLEEFLWLKRPVVVFADSPHDPRFGEQIKLLLDRPGELAERDVVVITDTDPAARTAIRTRLRPRGFMLTLIAKDGRVNLRKPVPWDVREISHTIDKWPLRKQEIRDAKAEAAAATAE